MQSFLQDFVNWVTSDYNRVIALVAVFGGVIGALLAPFLRFPLQLRAVRSQEKLDAFKATIAGLEANIRSLEIIIERKDSEIAQLQEFQKSHDTDRDHWFRTRAQLSQRIEELQARNMPWPDQPPEGAVIIVVEDDSYVARVMCRMMERLGYEAFVTTKGYDALRHLRTGQFRLMVLDFGLPDINGIDVAIMARRDGHTIPIIGLTGVASDLPRDTPRMLEAKFTAVLPKTSRADEIMAAVRSAIEINPTGDCC